MSIEGGQDDRNRSSLFFAGMIWRRRRVSSRHLASGILGTPRHLPLMAQSPWGTRRAGGTSRGHLAATRSKPAQTDSFPKPVKFWHETLSGDTERH
jgi:hypothetical protein